MSKIADGNNNSATISVASNEIKRSTREQRQFIESHSIEKHEDFTLGVVEFDDQGDLWSRNQVKQLETMIVQEAKRENIGGLQIVVFAHGWNHNASICDENVVCFRELLRYLGKVELLRASRPRIESTGISAEKYTPKRVIGVYLGWRGLSSHSPILNVGSFYSRKSAAHRVGQGGLVELLSRLEVLRDSLNESSAGTTRLIVIGHSFGGAAVYTAVSTLFQERLTQAIARARDRTVDIVRGYGDLVILINPAFEASLYSGIDALSRVNVVYSPRQRAVLVTISSETDWATKWAFWAGRMLSTLFQHTASHDQANALVTTLGNYTPFRTHKLVSSSTGGGWGDDVVWPKKITNFLAITYGWIKEKCSYLAEWLVAEDCGCAHIDAETLLKVTKANISSDPVLEPKYHFADRTLDRDYGSGQLMTIKRSIDPNFPFIVAEAADQYVTSHNGIFNYEFLDFLTWFVTRMEFKSSGRFLDTTPN